MRQSIQKMTAKCVAAKITVMMCDKRTMWCATSFPMYVHAGQCAHMMATMGKDRRPLFKGMHFKGMHLTPLYLSVKRLPVKVYHYC